MSEPTGRHDPRQMLALIALAVDLPVPPGIRLYDNGILAMTFDRLNDALAWSKHLGGQTRTYVNKGNNRRYLDEGAIVWRGWRVQLHAGEPATPNSGLDADTAAALREIANPGGEHGG